ncbi:MAG: phage head-tail connector protein [Rhizobiales bacterium]|nr:phage head-tail connector protein [Hyphomicrobiales bacterium]MBI3672365.1 phage head-tail connector protein [Hyphomicrobiales bacterium]
MPSILTAPPAIEPVTLAEAKTHLRVGQADDDEFIGTLIVAARRQIEAQTGLALVSQGWSYFRDAWPECGSVELPLAPLIAVTAVTVYGDDDTSAEIDPAHYYVDRASRPPRLVLRGSRVWPVPGRAGNGIEVALTAGFGTAASAVPEDLRLGLKQLIAHWFENRGTGREPDLPLTVSTVIARYREMRL